MTKPISEIISKTCQNVGCRSIATTRYKLQDGRRQWRCVKCATKKSKNQLTQSGKHG